jgi:sucrose-6-phosphate hydrolase SacC (GH32 family)
MLRRGILGKQALHCLLPVSVFALAASTFSGIQAGDILFADFEADTYGDWKTTGTAFGKGPARGTLPGQMPVSGFRGKGLVNSFLGGDGPTGTLTSPEFKIERRYISFLIGGGGFPGKTCMNLVVVGKMVRTATGPNTESGGSEKLEPDGWDVAEFLGRRAHIEIVDQASGGWGHINVDHIVFTDQKPPMTQVNPARAIAITSRFLFFPVKTGAPMRKVTLTHGDKIERWFDIELADKEPEWWAPLDVDAWRRQTVTIKVDKLPADSKALAEIEQGDVLKGATNLYREPLRSQLHFSPRRGWTNDPNGLVFFNGDYHLFFQHNPYGWNWGNMHWGHAVSKDLVHWQELGEALYPDKMGPMFSGSAVVDWQNTSGLGKNGKPPLVLIYTAAGNPAVQCLAFSNNGGKSFTKYSGNPVVKQITPGNRDPKVIWHEPTKSWVMVLYVELGGKHTIHFLTSPNLKDWTVRSQVDSLFECPDLFELPLDGKASEKKWILTAASSEYMVGTFDGLKFHPETPKLPGHRGRGFYAAQTFSDIRDGRRIQIGWLQAPSPGMSFNQAMTVPLELRLAETPAGPRLSWLPVRELDSLRTRLSSTEPLTLKPVDPNPLAAVNGELLDIAAVFEPGKKTILTFEVRGVEISYDASRQELTVNGHRTTAPLQKGKLDLRILADRTAFEVFACGGQTYVPMPVIPSADKRSVLVLAKGGTATFQLLQVWQMASIWRPRPQKQAPRQHKD